MKNKKFHITILTLLIWNFCFSQQFTNYTTKDGLPSNHIYKVIQDFKGFLWIATDKGLVKYDGTDFKTFTTKDGLANNDIWSLNATPDGKIWYQSKASKVGYIKNDSVYAFESHIKGEILTSLLTNQVGNEIILTNGNKSHILINKRWKTVIDNAFNNGQYKYYIKHKNISQFIVNNKQDSLFVIDKNKNIVKYIDNYDFSIKLHKRGQLTDSLFYWVSDDNYKILNLNTLKLVTRNLKDQININLSQHTRINLINNKLQISGRGFVGVLDDEFHIKNTYYFPEEIDAHFGFIDASQNIWLCTFSNGLYKLPKVKRHIKYVLNHQKVNYLDFVGNKVIATVYNKGFYSYDFESKDFKMFLDKPYFLFQPNHLKELNTTFYLSKQDMISVEDNVQKTVKFSTNLKNNKSDINKKLIYYKGFIYGIHAVGIYKVDPETYAVLHEYTQQGTNFLYVFNDELLIATTNGLKKLKNNRIEDVIFKNAEFDKSILNIHKISDAQVLINTDGFGAYLSDLKTIKQLPKSEFLIVNNAFVADNNVWLATNKGILKYIYSKGNYVFQKTINSHNGLPSDDVNDVFVYDDKILASTNLGVAILPIIQHDSKQFLDVYIKKANYNSSVILENSTFTYQDKSNFSFEIAAIDYSENASDFTYQYKLEPVQKEWISTSSNAISFNELLPDSYQLRIRVNAIDKVLKFTIRPLWWQTSWFKIVVIIIGLSLLIYIIWFLIRWTSKKEKHRILQEQKFSELQLKALRSQMNPHFVFNSLAAIQYYINENDFETSEYYLVKFSKLIRQFFDMSVMSKLSIEEELRLLKNYLEIEKLRFKDKLAYSINVDAALEKREIPTMLLQPIVENAINHGIFNKLDKGIITINFIAISPSEIKVEIIDDGVGFEKTLKKSKSNKSSQVLKDRIHFLNLSKDWEVQYFNEIAFPEANYVGNKSVFIIKKL
ncbi:histidine kinase [Flavobacterium ardleyense]|uniref:Histidine kinase n=1 Tax=Flavobacterium ardleyense TaxID=2038737 RepID=A0ABW5ZAQ4_9FLAO